MRVLWAMLCATALGGCATDWWNGFGGSEPKPVRVAGVPFHPQQGYACGPAPMAAMLGWAGVPVDPQALSPLFETEAADPGPRMAETARRFGRLAYPVSGMEALVAELEAGHPVLVIENLGMPAKPLWHCAVATGFDRAEDRILLQSGADPSVSLPIRTFERLWGEDGSRGMVVMRPGSLPATADEDKSVAAAAGLEKAGRAWEAILSYDAALSRWPTSGKALMGLGSSLLQLGDPVGAAEAYRAAASVSADPSAAEAALALALAEKERRDAAELLAENPAEPTPPPVPRPRPARKSK